MIPTDTALRQGFTTPSPQYVSAPPSPTVADKRAWVMEPHEKLRIRSAAFRATRLYPGPVGALISRELLSFEEMGLRLARDGVVMGVVEHVLKSALTP